MYNKKTLAVIGMTALMLVTMAGCGSKNNSAAEVKTTTATTAAPVKVENETKKSVTEATTEAVTEAVTEAQTETQAASEEATEAVTEAPAEVVEAPAVAPVQEEVHTQSGVVIQQEESAQTSKPGIISNKTADKITLNADGTVSTPDGTYAGVTAYNEATGHTDHNDPEHLTQRGYLVGDAEGMKEAFIKAAEADGSIVDPDKVYIIPKPAVNPYK